MARLRQIPSDEFNFAKGAFGTEANKAHDQLVAHIADSAGETAGTAALTGAKAPGITPDAPRGVRSRPETKPEVPAAPDETTTPGGAA